MAEYDYAMQMANTAFDSAARVMEAFLAAISDRTSNPEDKKILRTFEKYISEGGMLLTIPVDQENSRQFEMYLESSDVMAYKTSSGLSPGVYDYIFRDRDRGVIDELVLQMRRDGMNLLPSCRMDYSELMEQSEYQIFAGISKDAAETERLRLNLDRYRINYACTAYPDDRTEIAVSSVDYERIQKLPGLSSFPMTKSTQKKGMRDVNQIINNARDAAQAREAEKALNKAVGRKEKKQAHQ